ncbi:pilus assembly protein CpaC [Cupriavidus gilardii J11]|uniref:Pilus assembly protein CpaC n=1 Tax=Cupriavidus gilardii J11 TaxID=936133 RepID=A0A562B9H9_9BURK|nr:pilus assembly protein CpaC [Cupriavidus gilardii J11]
MVFPRSRACALTAGAALIAVSASLAALSTPACGAEAPAAPGDVATVSDTATAGRIRLTVGTQQELRLPGPMIRVAVGNPAVADALLLKSPNASPAAPAVLVVAKKPGATDLMIWPADGGAVRHYGVQVDATAGDDVGARIRIDGKAATIDGESLDAAAAARAQQRARAAVGSGPDGGVVIDRSTVPTVGTVQVDVKVIEISKSVLKQAGFNFYRNHGGFAFGTFSPSTLGKVGFRPDPGGSFSADVTAPISSAFNLVAASMTHGIFANLSLLEGNGMARILAEPSLVALSGQSASFLAGGEIPIPVPQALGTTTIQYKPFGIGLTVTPTVLSDQRIALKVAPEASDLDPSRGVAINGAVVPAIVTRRADTTVELGDGESFVIGGLVSRNTVSQIDKVPLLGDLPLIGAFFKNLNFHQEDRELMIVVTPHRVRPLAKGAPALAAVSGDGRTAARPAAWGPYLGGALTDPALPGFSR